MTWRVEIWGQKCTRESGDWKVPGSPELESLLDRMDRDMLAAAPWQGYAVDPDQPAALAAVAMLGGKDLGRGGKPEKPPTPPHPGLVY